MAKKLFSVLTDDLRHCYVTESPTVAIHHVFPGTGRRKLCEVYGFVIPLRPDYHTSSDYAVHMNPNKDLDLRLKQECQRYFEEHYGSRQDFISHFGKSLL